MTDLELEGARQLRFLVVDDCEDICEVLCCFIERAGHLTRTAGDGVEALELLQRESFDVMLLDLHMPRMGGVAVARWLQAHPDVAPAMRIVVVTASDVGNMALLLELGVASVLPKPLPLQRLRSLMTQTAQDLESSQLIGGVAVAAQLVLAHPVDGAYADTERGFAEHGAALRARLVAECDRLLAPQNS